MNEANGNGSLAFGIPPEFIQQLAEATAEELAARQQEQPAPYLNTEGAAEYLATNERRIYDLVSAGRLPHHRDGKRLLFRAEELDAYLESSREVA